MFKWILFLSVLSVIDAQMVPGQCVVPRLANGRLRWRSRSKLIRFSCNYGFELVGSRYATCRNAQWDTPKPTCVKPGCPVPQLTNGLVITSRSDAFLVFFCLPGFKLVGTTAMYCDGKSWNTTMPSCIDSTMVSKTSCDFEDPDLCGWAQDSLHDFDWERLNRKTPSSFMNTGPSYDHTIGKGGAGYYMYIESSSRLENETARLISPIYDMEIAKDGCFSFYYHMFGRYLGGLRVYQKPDNIPLQTMLKLPEETRKKYVLFEQWGDQGDFWYRGVSQLHDFGDNFQIVMEGIRGKRFTSDIAIDDVAILQGENCTIAKRNMVTPPPAMLPSTCEGRCGSGNLALIGCSCAYTCLVSYNCCPDYFEVCLDMIDSTTEDTNLNSAELPQTQKLVARNTTERVENTPVVRIASTTEPPTTPKTTSRATTKVVTTQKTTHPTTSTTTSTTTSSTTKRVQPRVTKDTVFQKDAINENANTTEKIQKVTTPKMVRPFVDYKPTKMAKGTPVLPTSTVRTTKFVKYTKAPKPRIRKANATDATNALYRPTSTPAKSSAWRPVLITLAVLVCGAGLAWLAAGARGARGRAALATLRGRATHDPELLKVVEASVVDQWTRAGDVTQLVAWRGVLVTLAVLVCGAGLAWLAAGARGARGRAALATLRGRATHDPEVRYLHSDNDDE